MLMFVDYAKIFVESGRGGSGCVSFRREKFVPKGGPDGGDGGRGGSVIAVGNAHMHSLLDFQSRKHFRAKRGEHGKGANKHGKGAQDVIIKVPVGTMIYDNISGELLGDIKEADQRLVLAKGGKGGPGNARYVTPTNQAPREWKPGVPGEEKEVRLELKLIADVGLVGLPNAGKSTLLSRISNARPKIADYPFTTLKPNLGVVKYRDKFSFVIADIPGLIEGAHTGKGLGHEFLRHIERTKVLLFMIDITADDPFEDLRTLQEELEQYDQEQLNKPKILAINKCDVFSKEDLNLEAPREFDAVFYISAVTGEGLVALKDAIWQKLSKENPS